MAERTRTGAVALVWKDAGVMERSAGARGGFEALDFPPDAFTGVFAIGRSGGWIAHAREQVAGGRLIRPQSRYVGPRPLEAA